jgi:hypothetical protein
MAGTSTGGHVQPLGHSLASVQGMGLIAQWAVDNVVVVQPVDASSTEGTGASVVSPPSTPVPATPTDGLPAPAPLLAIPTPVEPLAVHTVWTSGVHVKPGPQFAVVVQGTSYWGVQTLGPVLWVH